MELNLPLARFRITVEARTPIVFHHYSGSAWRGVFGRALRKAACVTSERDCEQCMLYRSCVYSYIFETPPPTDARFMRRYTAAPHPFVLSPDPALRELAPGERTDLELVLTGKATELLPYVLHALERAGKQGIGASDGRFDIAAVWQERTPGDEQWLSIYEAGQLRPTPATVATPPPLPDTVTLTLATPLRLKHRDRLLSPNYFPFSGLVAALLRRYSMMSYFHDAREFIADFRALVDQAAEVTPLAQSLDWQDWRRYSSRQRRKIAMGGVVGSVQYRGDEVAPFWPLLWTGQWLHLGKGTSMGLGRFLVSGDDAVETRDIRAA